MLSHVMMMTAAAEQPMSKKSPPPTPHEGVSQHHTGPKVCAEPPTAHHALSLITITASQATTEPTLPIQRRQPPLTDAASPHTSSHVIGQACKQSNEKQQHRCQHACGGGDCAATCPRPPPYEPQPALPRDCAGCCNRINPPRCPYA